MKQSNNECKVIQLLCTHSAQENTFYNYLLFFHEFPLGMSKLAYYADSMRDCDFRSTLFPWYEYPLSYEIPRIPQTVSTKFRRDYSADNLKTASQEYHLSGFIERYPVDTSGLTPEGVLVASVSDIVPGNMEYLRKLIGLCSSEDIDFVAVTTPLPLPLLQEGASLYMETWEYFASFFENEGIKYINYNDMEHFNLFTHDIAAFTDMDGHMNGDAARAFSRVLATEL